MRALTRAEAVSWCVDRRLRQDSTGRVRFEGADSRGLRFPLPAKALEAVARTYKLMDLEDEAQFQGAMVWLSEWGFWSEELDRVGVEVCARIRASAGADPNLNERPATLFDRDEFLAAHAFAVQPVIFQWDAYLLPAAGDFFFFLHHHEWCYALARDETALAYLKTRLRAWDFTESLEGY